MFHADRDHIHHRLLAVGFTHRGAVLLLWGISVVFGGLALGLAFGSQGVTFAMTATTVAVATTLLWRLGYLGIGAGSIAEQRDVQQALAISRIAERLPVENSHEIWDAVRAVSAAVDADCVRLVLEGRGQDGEQVTRTFAAGFDDERIDRFIARFHLHGDKRDRGFVEFGWEHPSARLEPRTDEAIREFCLGLASGSVGRHAVARGEAKVIRLRR